MWLWYLITTYADTFYCSTIYMLKKNEKAHLVNVRSRGIEFVRFCRPELPKKCMAKDLEVCHIMNWRANMRGYWLALLSH